MDIRSDQGGSIPVVTPEEFARACPQDIDACRRVSPVLRTSPERVVALRADDVLKLTRNPRLVQLPGDRLAALAGTPPGYVTNFLTDFMLLRNGDEHRKLRGAFAKTFAHPVMRRKREQIRATADRIVADLPRGETFDFLDLCASRLPAEMIAAVLGFPTDQSRWFARQVYAFSCCLTIPYAIDRHDEIEAAARALYEFTTDTLAERRKNPRDDLLSMLATDSSARALEPEVLVHQVMGVILAGSDTTRAAFNMLVGRLLQDPSLWQEVLENQDLIPAAVNEGLRLEPPVGSMPRYSKGAIELDGVTVEPEQHISLSTLSAMRDERHFQQPEEFRLHRPDHKHPHPVFGGGAHRCLGEMLARIELEEGLAALMAGAPGIELVSPPRMEGTSGIRRTTPLMAIIR